MKKLFLICAGFLAALSIYAQEPAPAIPGTVYGSVSVLAKTVVNVNDLEKKIGTKKYEGQVQGKVVEVCQAMGCWAKLQKDDGSTVMIKVPNHEFAMPLYIVGKTIIAEGEATTKETSVKQLKHYAEDAGKSKEEIEKITEPKKEVLMMIKGVKVVS
jgi:disulfide oxidoreductase YuzD